jgi:DNA repair protein RecO (recombination protein O)
LCLDQPNLDLRAIVLRFEMQMLRLSGLMPSLQQCVGCGKEVVSKDWLIFGAAAGGVLCTLCSPGHKQMIRIPVEVRDYLQAYGNPLWRSIPVHHYTSQWRATIRAMMVKTIAGTLDRRMKLHPYLEELGR